MTVVTADTHDAAHQLLDSNALRLGALIMPAALWEREGQQHPFGPGFRGVVDYIPSHLDPEQVREHMAAVPFGVLHAAFDHAARPSSSRPASSPTPPSA